MIHRLNPADGAVIGSWSATAFAWLSEVNEVLQFIALVAAIVSAVYAIRVHKKKLDE